jgi:hypothetical protein
VIDDKPLRVALEQTLTGLKTQFPTFDQEYAQGFEGDDTCYEHLHWMIDQCIAHLNEWPADKISRWIGYVQGVLTCRGIMDPSKERDRTRPFFHEAYVAMGWKKPETLDRKTD